MFCFSDLFLQVWIPQLLLAFEYNVLTSLKVNGGAVSSVVSSAVSASSAVSTSSTNNAVSKSSAVSASIASSAGVFRDVSSIASAPTTVARQEAHSQDNLQDHSQDYSQHASTFIGDDSSTDRAAHANSVAQSTWSDIAPARLDVVGNTAGTRTSAPSARISATAAAIQGWSTLAPAGQFHGDDLRRRGTATFVTTSAASSANRAASNSNRNKSTYTSADNGENDAANSSTSNKRNSSAMADHSPAQYRNTGSRGDDRESPVVKRARTEREMLEEVRSLVECELTTRNEISHALRQVAELLADSSYTSTRQPAGTQTDVGVDDDGVVGVSGFEEDDDNVGGGGGDFDDGDDWGDGGFGGFEDVERDDDGDGFSRLQRHMPPSTSKDELATDINKQRRARDGALGAPLCECNGASHRRDCSNMWLAYGKATIAALERVRMGAPAMRHLLAALDEAPDSLPHLPKLRLFVSPGAQTHILKADRQRRNWFLDMFKEDYVSFVAAWRQGRAVAAERDDDEEQHHVKSDLAPDDEDTYNRLRTSASRILHDFNLGRMSDDECRAALIDALVVDDCLVRALRLSAHGKREAAIRLVAVMGAVVGVLFHGYYID